MYSSSYTGQCVCGVIKAEEISRLIRKMVAVDTPLLSFWYEMLILLHSGVLGKFCCCCCFKLFHPFMCVKISAVAILTVQILSPKNMFLYKRGDVIALPREKKKKKKKKKIQIAKLHLVHHTYKPIIIKAHYTTPAKKPPLESQSANLTGYQDANAQEHCSRYYSMFRCCQLEVINGIKQHMITTHSWYICTTDFLQPAQWQVECKACDEYRRSGFSGKTRFQPLFWVSTF